MPRKTVPVSIKVIRSDVAPGFTNYKIEVSKGEPKPKALKIDNGFAELFLARMEKEAPRMAAFTRKKLTSPRRTSNS
jgi:hypothetical protein